MVDLKKITILAQELDKTQVLGSEVPISNYVEVELGSSLASRYKIKAKIGEGGMGVVYSGVDSQLERPVAIKLLKKNVSQDKKAVTQLKEEVQVSMMLTHPPIMQLISFEQDGGYAFLLMEYINGRDLLSISEFRPDKRLDAKTVAQVGLRVCTALDYAHKKNVIHRDIKPANIMISNSKEVKLMDFGIAKVLLAASTEHPQISGTLAYIAPEVFLGEKPDARCDLYSLGLTLYELLAGELPFKVKTVDGWIQQHLNQVPPAIDGVDRDLNIIISRCLEKKPNTRFPSAAHLRVALSKYLGLDEGEKVSRMKSKVEREQRMRDQDRQKMERCMAEEMERIDDEKQEINRRGVQFVNVGETNSTGFSVSDLLASCVEISSLLAMVAIAAACGFAGAGLASILIEGDYIVFESLWTYRAVVGAVTAALIIGGPSLYKVGKEGGIPGFFIGTFAGFAGGYGTGFFDDMLTQADVGPHQL